MARPLLIGAFLGATCLAGAETRPADPQQTFLLDQASQVRDDLAAMLEHRADIAPALAPAADLAIDLRIVAAQMLDESAGGDGDESADAYLRAGDLLLAAASIEPRLAAAAPDPAQRAALAKLHLMTYKLPATSSAATMDALCGQLASLLQAGGGGPEAQTSRWPLMRPDAGQAAATAKGAGKSLEELTSAARAAAVSPALRRELLALSAVASAAKDAKDAPEAYDVLSRVIDLTRGLQHGGTDQSQSRASVEEQLADGIALFLDVRTRAAGKGKVERLGRYRQMLDEVRELNVAPDVQNKLTPAFLWAQKHPEAGAGLMQSAPGYLQTCSKYDALKPIALPAPQQRAIESMRRQFDLQRKGYLTDAATLIDAPDATPASSEDFVRRAAAMTDIEQSLELINTIPATVQVLNRYKPRPAGGLERGALVSISAIAGAIQNPKPDQARRFLVSLDRLSNLAAQVANVAQTPADIDKLYARNRLSQLDRRRGEMLLELIGQAAAGRDIGRGLDQLELLKALADALPEAAAAEAALKQGDAQGRWEDWRPPAEALAGVMHDYREATAATFEAVTSGDAAAAGKWVAIHRRLEPILSLTITAGADAAKCEGFPTGWSGALARLATPLDHQPFAAERYASMMLAAWKQASANAPTDPTAAPDAGPSPADAILDALSARLRKLPRR